MVENTYVQFNTPLPCPHPPSTCYWLTGASPASAVSPTSPVSPNIEGLWCIQVTWENPSKCKCVLMCMTEPPCSDEQRVQTLDFMSFCLLLLKETQKEQNKRLYTSSRSFFISPLHLIKTPGRKHLLTSSVFIRHDEDHLEVWLINRWSNKVLVSVCLSLEDG